MTTPQELFEAWQDLRNSHAVAGLEGSEILEHFESLLIRASNRPAAPARMEFDNLEERNRVLIDTANRWLGERPELRTGEEAAKAADFDSQLLAQSKALDENRKAEGKPLREAVAAINDRYKPLAEAIGVARNLIEPLLRKWQQAERDRQQAEKRRQEEAALRELEAAEEAARAAAAAAQAGGGNIVSASIAALQAREKAQEAVENSARVDTSGRVKGEYATRARALRTYWFWKVEDARKIPAGYMAVDGAKITQAIQSGVREIPGIKIWPEERSR